jgi:hypothetical protein
MYPIGINNVTRMDPNDHYLELLAVSRPALADGSHRVVERDS